jgi:hypothetical protein
MITFASLVLAFILGGIVGYDSGKAKVLSALRERNIYVGNYTDDDDYYMG